MRTVHGTRVMETVENMGIRRGQMTRCCCIRSGPVVLLRERDVPEKLRTRYPAGELSSQ